MRNPINQCDKKIAGAQLQFMSWKSKCNSYYLNAVICAVLNTNL